MKHLGIGAAVQRLRAGCQMHRTGWAPRMRSVMLVQSRRFHAVEGSLFAGACPALAGKDVELRAHFYMLLSDGTLASWTPSQEDVLAQDWAVVSDPAWPTPEQLEDGT